MITNEQQNRCKAILMEQQSRLIKQVQDHFGLQSTMQETTGELSTYDNHPADMGTELFERGKDIALNEHAEKKLEEINSALHAINEGTYGICVDCGIDIPFERLEIVPTTDRCKSHASDQVSTHDFSVETASFSPNLNPNEGNEETQVGYDAEDTWQNVSQYGTSETPSDFYGDRDNYSEMYPNSDELVGSTEVVEDFLAADIEGKFSGVTPNHQKYEQEYEE